MHEDQHSPLSEELSRKILTLIDSEQTALSRLHAVLESEQAAIKTKDIDSINTTLTGKLDLLDLLQQLDGQRRDLLKSAGCDNSRKAFEQLLQRLGDSELLQQWSCLVAELSACHELHRVNIQLLDAGQRQVRRVLSVIMGSQNRPTETLYDQGGVASQTLSTNTFAKV